MRSPSYATIYIASVPILMLDSGPIIFAHTSILITRGVFHFPCNVLLGLSSHLARYLYPRAHGKDLFNVYDSIFEFISQLAYRHGQR